MDTLEINKIVGAVVGALLIYLGAQFFAEMILSPGHKGEEYAYSVEIEEDEGDSGGEAAAEPEIDVAALIASGDPSRGENVFRKCSACHKVEPGANGVGPHLYGVVGREIGAVEEYSYSGALSEQAEVWTPENLFAFLENPSQWAPGTSMGYAGLKKPEDRAAVIAYLADEAID
ncbi:MAG TPA: cytochrome c family protein [Paracoccaceae bacterium]|nr:cytochrome c family protein [Paracoccaceae bacterium]